MIKVVQRGALRRWPPFIAAMLFGCCLVAAQAEEPSYVREVQPLLRKYCGGCHNEADREGDFSVANHAVLLKGTPDGPVIKPGDAAASRLLQLISGKVEPRMPPEDEAQPTPEQRAIIEKWIAAGAVSDADRVPLQEQMLAPKLRADAQAGAYVTAMIDAGPRWVAVAKYGGCEIRDAVTQQVLFSVGDLPGKINQLRLSPDGQYLMIATGIAGIGGQVVIVDCAKRTVAGRLQGHTDTIYAAAMSPDGKWIATGSYDRVALLWDWKNNKVARKFAGHNGAIYDVDIDPEGKVLATASADQTIKLWGLGDGNRLDTLGQPEGEMLCVRFTPDGRYVLGAGADRQLRLWELISKDRPAINPLRQSRFAHEDPVTQLVFRSTDQVVSLSEDRTVKLWQLDSLKPIGVVTRTEDIPTGVAKCSPGNDQLLVVDYAGNVSAVTPPVARSAEVNSELSARASGLQAFKTPEQAKTAASVEATAEAEPNSRFEQAQPLSLPARVQGVVADEHNGKVDVDWFVFEAKAGQSWVMEVNAARMKSPLDSLIDVLDDQGQPVLRTRLQAIRESYFTFRGKDSNTSDDFRLHKWQEMELNELLYAGGEVVKLWLYPRGPDSGFKVYPGFGARVNFFDTTATAHALGEQAFVVRELAVGEEPLPNGLPLFSIYYQNDDDAQRRWGKDSRLEFTAPSDGRYWLRVRDARGFGGDDYRYELTIRQPQPDFELEIKGLEMAMPRGSGREWQVNAKRFDGLAGPIEIHLDNLPSGFVATNPLVIEAGQDLAYGNLFATAEAQLPEGRDQLEIQLTARSTTPAGEVVHQLNKPLTVKLTEAPEVQLVLVDANDPKRELDELVIHPGETISAKVVIKRGDQTGPVGLGKEDSGRNLPHGSFVDNIGLNGLLIPDGTTEREFFIRAADWLEPQQRLFHLRSDTKNNPTSRSIRLRVVPK